MKSKTKTATRRKKLKPRHKRVWAVWDPFGNFISAGPDRTCAWWFAAEARGYFGRGQYIEAMEKDGFIITAIYIRAGGKP